MYKCQTCDKSFKYAYELKRHEKRITPCSKPIDISGIMKILNSQPSEISNSQSTILNSQSTISNSQSSEISNTQPTISNSQPSEISNSQSSEIINSQLEISEIIYDKDGNINNLINILIKYDIDNETVNKIISEYKSSIRKKGSYCSINGKKYEETVCDIVCKCYFTINKIMFNTQTKEQLGGCSSKYDLVCKYDDKTLIPIEIKKKEAPDWTQRILNYNHLTKKWTTEDPIFNELLRDKILFNGNIPPFYDKKITYEEWKNIKSQDNNYKDIYFDCPSDTIKKSYSAKGCIYIQISENGLYHLGNDICKFNVPEFICDQRIRIRIKVHSEKNKDGYCSLSTTMSCQPRNINNIVKSLYSLDHIGKLPHNLLYND